MYLLPNPMHAPHEWKMKIIYQSCIMFIMQATAVTLPKPNTACFSSAPVPLLEY